MSSQRMASSEREREEWECVGVQWRTACRLTHQAGLSGRFIRSYRTSVRGATHPYWSRLASFPWHKYREYIMNHKTKKNWYIKITCLQHRGAINIAQFILMTMKCLDIDLLVLNTERISSYLRRRTQALVNKVQGHPYIYSIHVQ